MDNIQMIMFRMSVFITMIFIGVGLVSFASWAQDNFETDIIKTSAGDLVITFIGHGTLMFQFGDKIIHVDPWTKLADYTQLPKADIILLTHEHPDHLDLKAIKAIRKERTDLILPLICDEKIKGGTIMANGDSKTVKEIEFKAVPAYNIIHMRPDGAPYHQKGIGNGYVITFGNKKVYVAGDTENIPEMKSLKDIDVAFLPMNLPYTMTPEMCARAAKSFSPKILYPYHYGDTDTSALTALMKNDTEIEIRIR